MGRKSHPWYRKARDCWMATIHGEKVSLGVTGEANEEAAVEAFRRLLKGSTAKPVAAGEAGDRYLAGIGSEPGTVRIYTQYVRHFLKAVGRHRDLNSLGAADVEATAKPGWSDSTTHGYIGCIGVFLRAAGVSLDRKLKRPSAESRGATAVWTEQELYMILGASRGDFRAVVQVLWATGARPAEVAGLTVEGVDWATCTATLKRHKNKAKGKIRVIHFPEPAMVVLRAQKAKHGSGALFRQGQGVRHPEKQLNVKSMGARMVGARDRAGVRVGVHLYGIRHSFITRALERGFTADQVAALVGNSAAVIRKSYSHVGANHDLMKKIASAVAG